MVIHTSALQEINTCLQANYITHGKSYTLQINAMILTASLNKQLKTNKAKVIHVTGRGGPQRCETSRFLHFLENRLIDDDYVVSLNRRPPGSPLPAGRLLVLISVRG
jgi:DNA topoisomerase VI subunit A